MAFASIISDLFAAVGCFSLTVLLTALAAVLVAARLGFAPAAARVIDRLVAGPGGGAP